MKFSCPNCIQHLEADEDMVGMELSCPTCSAPIKVPPMESGELKGETLPTANDILEQLQRGGNTYDALLALRRIGIDNFDCDTRKQVLTSVKPVFLEIRKNAYADAFEAATLLAALDDKEAEDYLFNMLIVEAGRADPGRNQGPAARCLGTLHSQRIVDRLISLLEEVAVASYAASALGDIGDTRATPALMKLLHDACSWPRIYKKGYTYPGYCELYCREALCKIGDQRFVRPLLEEIRSWKPHPNQKCRDEYRHFLKRFPVDVVPFSVEALQDHDTVTSWFVNFLSDVLKENAKRVVESDLWTLARITQTKEAGRFEWVGSDENGDWRSTGNRTVDCTEVHELACRELIRRGFPPSKVIKKWWQVWK